MLIAFKTAQRLWVWTVLWSRKC